MKSIEERTKQNLPKKLKGKKILADSLFSLHKVTVKGFFFHVLSLLDDTVISESHSFLGSVLCVALGMLTFMTFISYFYCRYWPY